MVRVLFCVVSIIIWVYLGGIIMEICYDLACKVFFYRYFIFSGLGDYSLVGVILGRGLSGIFFIVFLK